MTNQDILVFGYYGVGLWDDGRFVALEIAGAEEIAPTPVEGRKAVVDRYKRDFGYTVDNISADAGVNRSDFCKWMNGSLDSKSVKAVRIEDTLRTNPKLRPRQ
jgi:hypothetical protein